MKQKLTPDDWRELQAYLDTLLPLSSTEREAQLDSIGRGSAAREQILRELLAAEGRVLDAPDARNVAAAFDTSAMGDVVGAFVLDALIGQGGSSDVFRARRASDFSQTVAIKVLRSFSGAEFVARFERERDILAGLHHSHIARLYDAGTTTSGRPYLVLEYAEGKTLIEWAREPGRTLESVVRVMIQVCDAVDYAHRRLLVHRDLKPENILVTASGEPKLLDFGVAKLLESGRSNDLTQDALAPLTPAYAAPEQIDGGAVTTATDVYALGVLLYEALCGQHPYRRSGDTAAEVLRKITSSDVAVPSASANDRRHASGSGALLTQRSDLDDVILCALEKQPEARYPSAQALSDDLRAALAGEPVRARARTWTYLASRFVSRHRIAVGASTLGLIALSAAISVALWQGHVAERERARAEKRVVELRQLSNRMLFAYYEGIKPLAGSLPVQRQLVQDALSYLSGLRNDLTDDPALTRELADAYVRIGDIQGNFTEANAGDLTAAAASYALARELLGSLVGTNASTLSLQEAVANLSQKEAHLAYQRADIVQAKSGYEASIAGWRQILRELPSRTDAALSLASALDSYGDLMGRDGTIGLADPKAAVQHYAEARAIRESVAKGSPNFPGLQLALYESELRDGENAWAQGEKEIAVKRFELALERARALALSEPSNSYRQREVALVLTRLVPSYEAVDRLDASIDAAVGAASIMQKLLALDPSNEAMRSGVTASAGWAARQLMKAERYEEAAPYAKTEMLTALERLNSAPENAEYQAAVALAHRRAGNLAYGRGLYKQAITEHRNARTVQLKLRETAPESRMAAALSLMHIGRAYLANREVPRARESLSQATIEMREVVREKPTARFKEELVNALQLLGDAWLAGTPNKSISVNAFGEALAVLAADEKSRALSPVEAHRRDTIAAKLAKLRQ